MGNLFHETKNRMTVGDAWERLQLSGCPKKSCRSPFRDEKNPSFSIFNGGRNWKDHGTGEGGDVIDFIAKALGGNSAAAAWLGGNPIPLPTHEPRSAPRSSKSIRLPSKPHNGSHQDLWQLAEARGISIRSAKAAVTAAILKFLEVDGVPCYLITDSEKRAVEIRRIDGSTFFNGSKAFPLAGVDKSWFPGASRLRGAPLSTKVLLVEGATDLLTAFHLERQFRRAKSNDVSVNFAKWIPIAVLGATCKKISPDCAELLRGRHVRIVPDADAAGDGMAEHWCADLSGIGCRVDVVKLERETDLSDASSSINPEELFK